jgi:hypothetical protein
MSLLRNQIIGLSRAGASVAEIMEALSVESEVIELALRAAGGSVAGAERIGVEKSRREEREERKEREEREEREEEVSAEESKKMLRIIKNIALDDEVSVYAKLNAAKYVHGVRAGYHKKHIDINVGRGDIFLRINEAYSMAAEKARRALELDITPAKVLDTPSAL